jgi:lactose/L-arabinose transport system substrate-binding protein
MMKRNWLLLVAVCFLSAVLLSACSDKKDTEEEITIPENPEDITGDITVWAWALEASFLINDVLPKFEEAYPNVNVHIETLGTNQLYEKMNAGLFAGGSGLPDVAQVENNRIQVFTENFPDGFIDLGELGYDQYMDDFPDSKLEGLKNKHGELVAAPRDLGPVGVIYRTDIFEAAGVDPEQIETWDDYIEAGKKVVDHTGEYFLGSFEDEFLHIMLQQQGAFYFDDAGNIDLHSKETEIALKKIEEMKEAGLIAYTNNFDGQVSAMKNGLVATQPDAVWWGGTMLEQMPELSGKWGVFELPVFAEGDSVHASNNGGSALAIPSASENKAAAYAFTEFATTNLDMQIEGLKNRGLFPSLMSAYDEPLFDEKQEYFSNQKFFKRFADTVDDIPPVNYTGSNLAARDIMTNELQALLLEGKPVREIIKDSAKTLERQTGREIND